MYQEKLLWELEEEILLRVLPLSLTRFRTVSKRWNTLFNDNRFIRNHFARGRRQFILATESKFYSVSINLNDEGPKIEMHELTIDIPGLEFQKPINIFHHDGYLLIAWNEDIGSVWNPWLRQSIRRERNRKPENNSGYENLASQDIPISTTTIECVFKGKFHNAESETSETYECGSSIPGEITIIDTNVRLHGTLYWVASSSECHKKFFILCLPRSRKRMEVFCRLTCKKSSVHDAPILEVFKGDRLSLLEQNNEAKKIEIKVTKNKINDVDGGSVEWIKYMSVSISEFPELVDMRSYSLPSYFIDGKTLVMCLCDKNGQAWIFVARGNKMSKIQVEVDPWPFYTTYIPSLVPVPES